MKKLLLIFLGLGFGSFSQAQTYSPLAIHSNSKVLNRIPLTGQKGQQLIDTRNLPAGMYITSVVCKTGILKRDKLVISR
jgi:hypothetical protein